MNNSRGKVIVPANANPWPHEQRVAKILALAGHAVEFIPESNTKTADILLDGVEFEIKSPKSANANSLEHILKKAVKQSCNIIIDTSRMKNIRDDNTRRFLVNQARLRKQIKKLIMITKQGQIIDVSVLI
ncbi:MAG: hypothetical protein HXL13_00200 [Candidatus Nanosynbacter sp.]|jgi:hypothetical protein|nr:hypothetical protein [Candidatus Nanosynbacter sp.]